MNIYVYILGIIKVKKNYKYITSSIFCIAIICFTTACDMNKNMPQHRRMWAGGIYKVGKPYKIEGKQYTPKINKQYNNIGIASWYGEKFHYKRTANGETFDMNLLTAAHPTLPLPSIAKVTNLKNGRSIIVRINDRGPFKRNREIDLSKRAAEILRFKKQGTTKVRVTYINRAPLYNKKGRVISGQDQQYFIAPVRKTPERLKYLNKSPTTGTVQKYVLNKDVTLLNHKQYFIQTASFSNENSAILFANKIKNPKTHIHKVQNLNTLRFQVLLGPFTSQQHAKKILANIINNGHHGAFIKTQ